MRSPFVLSLLPYLRFRTETGGRVTNRLLDECDDPLVHQCVQLYEREHERCIAHRQMLEAQRLNNG